MTSRIETNNVVERLRRREQLFPAMGGGSIGRDASGKVTCTSYISDDGMRLVNPDGPEAADLIQSLSDRIAVLESENAALRHDLERVMERENNLLNREGPS